MSTITSPEPLPYAIRPKLALTERQATGDGASPLTHGVRQTSSAWKPGCFFCAPALSFSGLKYSYAT
jgi:hypothetical protein